MVALESHHRSQSRGGLHLGPRDGIPDDVPSVENLSEVLCTIAQELTQAVEAQSSYVWLSECTGGPLVLRAASQQYADAVGHLTMQRGEGFAGWVAQHGEPISIAERALSDPRARYFPEFEEEKYQSMTSVPLVTDDGTVIGALGLHAEAPRALDDAHASLIRSTAAIVTLAVQNARRAEALRDIEVDLDALCRLSIVAAEATSLADLLAAIADDARRVLRASSVHLYATLGGRLRRFASAPVSAPAPSVSEIGSLAVAPPAESGHGRTHRARRLGEPGIVAPLVADGETVGYLFAEGSSLHPRASTIVTTVASQAAVGIRRLAIARDETSRLDARRLFDAIASNRSAEEVGVQMRRLSFDPRQTLMVLEARGAAARPSDRGMAELASLLCSAVPRIACDVEADALRAIVGTSGRDRLDTIERMRSALREINADQLAIGTSDICTGADALANGLVEAQLTARMSAFTGRLFVTPDELGPYRYLLNVDLRRCGRDPYREAIERLIEHDRARRTELLRTLELYLEDRVVAAVSRTLFIHPNTLRQRLHRIEQISGLDLADDDRLTIEMAIRLARLGTLGPAPRHNGP